MSHYTDADRKAQAHRELTREELIEQYEVEMAQRTLEDETGQRLAFLNVLGQEVPDPTIVDPPLGYVQQPDLMELMRRMIRNQLSQAIEDTEFETFEEADDFDIDDDPVDYTSPYEEYFDPDPGKPAGPPGVIHPQRQDPNAPQDQQKPASDEPGRGGGGAEPPGGKPPPASAN